MSDSMKAQFQILGELRRIDEKVARLNKELERIPAEVAKLNDAIATRKQEYLKAKELTENAEKKLRKAELDLKEKEDKLKKAEDKMMEVKTNEEYQAAIKENSSQKTEKGSMEDSTLGLITELENQKNQLKEVEKTFKSYEDTIKKDLDQLTGELTSVESLLKEQIAERTRVAGTLNAEVRTIYLKVAARFKGITIVGCQNERCMGCNMKMRPQIYNEVLGYKAVHPCPNCGRLIVVESRANEDRGPEAVAK